MTIPTSRLFLFAALLTTVFLGACRSTGPATSAAAAGAETAGSEAPAVDDFKNTVKWTTASEVENFGFDVYRSESEEGPFERINPEIIEGAGTSDEPQRYQYVDRAIDPHKTYYYYVESISMSGEREHFTPVGKAPPKIRQPSEMSE